MLDPQVLERRGIFLYLNMPYLYLLFVKLLADLGAVLAVGAVEQDVFCVPGERRAACGQDEVEEDQDREERTESGDYLSLTGEDAEASE